MSYINTATGQYPVTLGDVRASHPNTCWPDSGITSALLAEYGFASVAPTPRPSTPGVTVSEGAPELVGGQWRQTWIETPMTTTELAVEAQTLQRQVAAVVQRHLDAVVQARGYESIATCVTYADEPAVPRFQAEGQAARAWRSTVWAACYAALGQVLAGERAPLSPEEMVAQLPMVVWPAE